MKEEHKYDDIINLEHPISKVHKQMSLENRSAQFAPFAALVGYEEAVKETERVTENRVEINEELRNRLDEKIYILQSKIKEQPEVNITYFVPDNKKKGGKYQSITGKIKQIDDDNKLIVLKNDIEIPINEIINISGEIVEIV